MDQQELNETIAAYNRWMLSSDRDRSGSFLDHADLDGLDLSGANLTDADLSGVSLVEAVLRDATLIRVTLQYAVMTDADLQRADLRGADLSSASFACANLGGANLHGANIRFATFIEANLEGTIGLPLLPKVPGLAGKVLRQITEHHETWNQSHWHCGTQHCAAGWTVVLAGDAGILAESYYGTYNAALILLGLPLNEPAPFGACDDPRSWLRELAEADAG